MEYNLLKYLLNKKSKLWYFSMEDITKSLKSIADPKRFQIINLLLKYDLCVGALANHLEISKAAVSQHLQILRKAGLVKGEKRGYWTHYSVERAVLHEIATGLIEIADQAPSSENICGKIMACESTQHGKDVIKMCKGQCDHPEKLQGKPGECIPEQIKECHGDVKDHPCEEEKK